MNTFDTMHFVDTSTRRITLAAGLLCVLAGAAPAVWAQAQAVDNKAPVIAVRPQTQVADYIVAIVNTEAITHNELVERMRAIAEQLKSQNTAMPPYEQFQKQVLERIVLERAQLQLAKEKGIQVDDIMLDKAMARIAEQNKLSLQALRDQLEREGTKYAKFREEIRDEITLQRLRDAAIDTQIKISDTEIDNFLDGQAASKQGPQELDLAHIIVQIPENSTAEQIAERRRRAEDILQQLKAGADFTKLAATYSDADDALKGGDLGWRNADRLPPLFLDAVANLEEGAVSELLKTANGFHILKLVGKRVPSVVKLVPGAAPVLQQTHVSHILIKVNQVVSAADARHKLADLKSRLDNKTDTFENLAKQYSNDLSASKGGDLGWVYPGDTVPEFEHAMDALQPGQVSEPIETQFGFHLIKVLERKSDDSSKERKRLAAKQAIRERKLDEATQDWLRQLRDRTYVEYHLDPQ